MTNKSQWITRSSVWCCEWSYLTSGQDGHLSDGDNGISAQRYSWCFAHSCKQKVKQFCVIGILKREWQREKLTLTHRPISVSQGPVYLLKLLDTRKFWGDFFLQLRKSMGTLGWHLFDFLCLCLCKAAEFPAAETPACQRSNLFACGSQGRNSWHLWRVDSFGIW